MSETTQTQDGFDGNFSAVVALIQKEWPSVASGALEGTAGDYDQVIDIIATETEHTKTLVRKQLNELREVAAADTTSSSMSNGEEKRIRQMLEKLQSRSNDVAKYVRKEMVTDAKKQVGDHPLAALLMAIGLGFILGFLLRSLGRDR